MPEFVLNCAGYSNTTGTADPVISGDTGKAGDPREDLADGQIVAYWRRYAGERRGYENAIGIWVEATNTINRTAIEKSSNNGLPVVWVAADQIIDITANVPMLETVYGTTSTTSCVGDDERLTTEDADELPAAEVIEGGEKTVIIQNGLAVGATQQHLMPHPVHIMRDYDAIPVNWYTKFAGMSQAASFTIADHGKLLGQEPFEIAIVGTGALSQRKVTAFNAGELGMSVAAIDDVSAIYSIYGPVLFYSPLSKFKVNTSFYTAAALNVGNNINCYFGFLGMTGAAITYPNPAGVYFRIRAGANIEAVTRNQSGTTTVIDTGVASAVAGVNPAQALSVTYAAGVANFYINGVEEAEITTTLPTDFSFGYYGAATHKSAGTAAVTVALSAFAGSVFLGAVGETNYRVKL